ncbi:hypothetical protein Hanom_Chr15g01398951 [Helianthus anomalus]
MMKTEPCDIICACGGQTVYKESESKENLGRRNLRCLGGCGFLRWADVGEEKGCQICREIMRALIQSIKDKDELTKCKDKLAEYKDQELKWKLYLGISWFMFFLLFVLMYAIDKIQKDEAIVAPIEEPES